MTVRQRLARAALLRFEAMEQSMPNLAAQEPMSFARSGNADPEAQAPAAHPHILVVDEDPVIRDLLTAYLGQNDLRVTTAADGDAMRALLGKDVIDLVVLDLKLGAESGLDLARQLRDQSAIPIVMLSGQSEEADRVMALELGADDYLTKPFSPRELLARLRAILRRRRLDVRQQRLGGLRGYRFGGWEVNLNTRQLVSPRGKHSVLTNAEFSLLVALLGAAGRSLSRAQLLELSRVHEDEVYDRAVDILIMRLRRKLGEDSASPRCIVTMRGVGYRFGVPVESIY
jgi:two-component system OmpR family response regulator